MAVAGRPEERAANSVADALREAAFVRLSVHPDGDSLAAAGLLARALSTQTIPFQASVVRTGRTVPTATDDTTTVLIGRESDGKIAISEREKPASETAFEVCRELDTEPDPVLALAGMFAAGGFEGSTALEIARERGLIEQRPGVAIPVADVADGLTHTTLAHAPFSGDSEATAAALDDCEATDTDDGRRRIASLLALSVASTKESTPRAAEAVERALRPYTITEPRDDEDSSRTRFETVGGFADVLCASAHERPGTGLALALGHDVCEAALAAWRTHGNRAHAALRNGTTERYRNVFVTHVGADTPLTTTARLLCDFRSPESIALAVGETGAAAAAREDANLGQRMRKAGAAADGDGHGSARRGRASFEDSETFVAAFREAVQ